MELNLRVKFNKYFTSQLTVTNLNTGHKECNIGILASLYNFLRKQEGISMDIKITEEPLFGATQFRVELEMDDEELVALCFHNTWVPYNVEVCAEQLYKILGKEEMEELLNTKDDVVCVHFSNVTPW